MSSQSTSAQVLWIGGSTDAGKTTVAGILSRRHGFPVYQYDRGDLRHHQRLAAASPENAEFLDKSLDDRRVQPTAEALAVRAWQAFNDRFPLVLEDLDVLTLPPGRPSSPRGTVSPKDWSSHC